MCMHEGRVHGEVECTCVGERHTCMHCIMDVRMRVHAHFWPLVTKRLAITDLERFQSVTCMAGGIQYTG